MTDTQSTQLQNQSGAGSRILVLEPNEQISSEILRALAEAAPGAHVDLARTIEEAQRLVLDNKPDLFVLDVDAAYDLGQEFLFDLRTSHPNARAIVLTGIHLRAHREQAAGLGAIHFLEKPFPPDDFIALVQALLQPPANESERFQGTLSELHIADIIQLKCMSGATSALEFTGPKGQKARIYFENGQVRHATAPGKTGIAAFNEIVSWRGGRITEVSGLSLSTRTIDTEWQVLLMEAVRKIDETNAAANAVNASAAERAADAKRRVLVIDDSVMLLNFVKEILTEAGYDASGAATAAEGIDAAAAQAPDLILLDYVLPDMKGDEVCERLAAQAGSARTPVVFMSGFGADLPPESLRQENVIGSINKPFTSEILLQSVETYISAARDGAGTVEEVAPPPPPPPPPPAPAPAAEVAEPAAPFDAELPVVAPAEPEAPPIPDAAAAATAPWWLETPPQAPAPPQEPDIFAAPGAPAEISPAPVSTPPFFEPQPIEPQPIVTSGAYFCGDSSFFSLNWALQTIAKEKLTGTLRLFWSKTPVDLLARDGSAVLVTTRDADLYCLEAPVTLLNVDAERNAAARAEQARSGCPLFITLAREGLILREPAIQLVQHYGQKLFAGLWTNPRVRFTFEQSTTLPDYANDVPVEDDMDHWALNTLRFIQYPELAHLEFDAASIPAYTRDGYERVQRLRLTVAEAQFASQFNGSRSVQQIAKNLRLDLKFARLTLFRFLALEIVELWPAGVGAKPERRGLFQRLGLSE